MNKQGKFATFNDKFKHQNIQCTDENETISIRTKSGKRLTVSILGDECADIAYHDSPIDDAKNGSSQFNMLGLNYGSTPIPKSVVTIAVILFN